MSKFRTQIPNAIAIEVMFLHDRTCCICRENDRRVQKHHIDENPSNHEASNLAVLCLECHDKTQIKGGFARHLQAGEVRRYREDWIERILSRRQHADESAAQGMIRHFPGIRPSIRVRSSDKGLQIIDSFLVSSFTDCGIGDFIITFETPIDPERLVVRVDGNRTLNYEMTPGPGSAHIKFTDPDRRAGEEPTIFLATFDDGGPLEEARSKQSMKTTDKAINIESGRPDRQSGGGKGGDAKVFGNGTALGGPGGAGGKYGRGGDGGSAEVRGDGVAAGGAGGAAGDEGVWRPPAKSGYEVYQRKMGLPVDPYLRQFGRGGAGAGYEPKLQVIEQLRLAYFEQHSNPHQTIFQDINAVPLGYLNSSLTAMSEPWRVRIVDDEYEFFLPGY